MENKYLLTIAIPTYNGAKTISNMLDLLLPQITSDIEILVSDNCSTDATPEIISEYQKSYPQICYIKNEKNLGADGNFLQCMLKASGKFTMLISDDDIIIEGAIKKITDYLKENPKVQLAYLDTVGFKNKYNGIESCHRYDRFSPQIESDLTTKNKNEFLRYAQRLWGFTSTYLWNTERMKSVINPAKYFDTYFLQCYMHIECSNNPDDLLGVIKGPCIAVGEYGIIGNYDTAKVEGVFYRKMIKKAVESGYNENQLMEFYKWKLCHLVSRAVIKEKIAGVKKTKSESIVEATEGMIFCRCYLLSVYYFPKCICKFILTIYRKSKGLSTDTYVNRPT